MKLVLVLFVLAVPAVALSAATTGQRETISGIRHRSGLMALGPSGHVFAAAHATTASNSIGIVTIEPNDAGIAHVIMADGLTIFHTNHRADKTRDRSDAAGELQTAENGTVPLRARQRGNHSRCKNGIVLRQAS